MKHFGVLMIKIIADCLARLCIFSAWMYVHTDGQFSTLYVVAGYYTMMMLMMIFNAVFNRNLKEVSTKYYIGNQPNLISVMQKNLTPIFFI